MNKYGFRMEKTSLSDYTAMKRDLSGKFKRPTPLELRIDELSDEYRSRVKFLQEEQLDITGDGVLSDIQEKYLALLVKNRAGKTKKHKKKGKKGKKKKTRKIKK